MSSRKNDAHSRCSSRSALEAEWAWSDADPELNWGDVELLDEQVHQETTGPLSVPVVLAWRDRGVAIVRMQVEGAVCPGDGDELDHREEPVNDPLLDSLPMFIDADCSILEEGN